MTLRLQGRNQEIGPSREGRIDNQAGPFEAQVGARATNQQLQHTLGNDSE